MRWDDQRAVFQQWNANTMHQRLAGVASWVAFSARWRAHGGLPLLHPMDVQYLTPADFCNGQGRPLPPEVQRRRFREYVEAAIGCGVAAQMPTWGRRTAGVVSAEVGLVRAGGFVRWMQQRTPDYVYGRADLVPYEARAVLPARPYGMPVVSEGFVSQSAYWLEGSMAGSEEDEVGDDAWISAFGCGGVE